MNPQERSQPSTAARVRRFELGSREINDLKMDMGRIDQVVPVDTTEIWEVTHRSGIPHNFHPHGTHLRVLDDDGGGALKDTVQIPPGATVRLATRFSDATGRDPFMFHCHLLQHEDRGMMGQLVVAGPGQRRISGSGRRPAHRHPAPAG